MRNSNRPRTFLDAFRWNNEPTGTRLVSPEVPQAPSMLERNADVILDLEQPMETFRKELEKVR